VRAATSDVRFAAGHLDGRPAMGSAIRHEDEPIPIHRHAPRMPPRPLTRMQPMTTAADTLRTIEMNAERAIVQELRIMIRDVLALRPHLGHEDRDRSPRAARTAVD